MSDQAKVTSDMQRQMLRHILATLAYRAAKVIDGAPGDFGTFRTSDTTRAAGEILSHIADLMVWANSMARGKQEWPNSDLLPWDQEVARFFSALKEFDDHLASDAPMNAPAERLFQAPIADALTHVGQIALLRRVAGAPIRGENYYEAEIVVGRVGAEQSTKRVEFE
jgi:hypothetical protein